MLCITFVEKVVSSPTLSSGLKQLHEFFALSFELYKFDSHIFFFLRGSFPVKSPNVIPEHFRLNFEIKTIVYLNHVRVTILGDPCCILTDTDWQSLISELKLMELLWIYSLLVLEKFALDENVLEFLVIFEMIRINRISNPAYGDHEVIANLCQSFVKSYVFIESNFIIVV